MLKYAFFLFLMAVSWIMADNMYITVEKAKLLDKPNLFGKQLGQLKYGDKVNVQNHEGAFFQCQYQGKTAYIHQSALTKKEIKLTADTKERHAGDDVAAATKGFDEQVEKSYQQSGDLRFDRVDLIEKEALKTDFSSQGTNFRKIGKLGEFQTQGGQP